MTWLKVAPSSNVPVMSVSFDVSHAPAFSLDASPSSNVPVVSVSFAASHAPMSW